MERARLIRRIAAATTRLPRELLHAGARRHEDPRVQRRVTICNAIALVLIALGLHYLRQLHALHVPGPAMAPLPIAVLIIALSIAFNHAGRFTAARVALLVAANGAALWMRIPLGARGDAPFFYALACLPLILGDLAERRLLVFGIALSIGCSLLVKIAGARFIGPPIAPAALQFRGQLVAILVTFGVLLSSVLHFVVRNERAERHLRRANDQLRIHLEQLRQANESLRRESAERLRVEHELRLAQKLEAVGQLAAGIAHEINTPIQYVGDNVRFLQDAYRQALPLLAKYRALREAPEVVAGSPTAVEELRDLERAIDVPFLEAQIATCLEEMVDGLGSISTIVRAMKEFAHPDRPEMAPADINRALTSTLAVGRHELKDTAIVETDFGELPRVHCHIGDLNQVFLNLLINAAQAIQDAAGPTGRKGSIRVQTRHEGRFVVVRITDSGCGIPASIRARIFDPFFTTKEVGRGSGQGLSIAHSIVVDRHGGSIAFESEVGRGTTFEVRLPVDGPSVAPASAA